MKFIYKSSLSNIQRFFRENGVFLHYNVLSLFHFNWSFVRKIEQQKSNTKNVMIRCDVSELHIHRTGFATHLTVVGQLPKTGD